MFGRRLDRRRLRTGHPPTLEELATGDRSDREARVRDLRAVVPLPEGTALARILGRYKMLLDPMDLSLAPHLMLDGYWEMWLTEALIGVVRPGMIVADVGANVGYFTLLMADLVGPAGRVHAFEPNPAVAALLRRSLIANGFADRVTLHVDPLGSNDGESVALYHDGEQSGGAFVSVVARPEYGVGVPLVVRRMDGIAPLAGVQLVKIDAEASEEAIWSGMSGLIAGEALATVFMEWSSGRYADPRSFLARVQEAGFGLALLDPVNGERPTNSDALLALSPLAETMLVLRRG